MTAMLVFTIALLAKVPGHLVTNYLGKEVSGQIAENLVTINLFYHSISGSLLRNVHCVMLR